jgi:hypothetical protein
LKCRSGHQCEWRHISLSVDAASDQRSGGRRYHHREQLDSGYDWSVSIDDLEALREINDGDVEDEA